MSAGGGAPAQSGGGGGADTSGGTSGRRGGDASGGTGGQSAGGTIGTSSSLALTPPGARLVVTGVRGVTSAAASLNVAFVAGGASAAAIAGAAFGAVDQVATTLAPSTQDARSNRLTPSAPLFQVRSPATFPVAVPAGATVAVTAQLMTGSAGLPAAPAQDSGATVLSSVLTVDTASGPVSTTVFAVILTQALWEPTLGELLYTLGIKLNVGAAQNNANPISPGRFHSLPGIEASTDEIAAPLFVKAGGGNVTLRRWRASPRKGRCRSAGTRGRPATRNMVATMASIADAQTSDKARMVLPPLTGGQTFDPAATPSASGSTPIS